MKEIMFYQAELWQRGHHGPSRVVTLIVDGTKHNLLIGAGTRDSVTVYDLGEGAYAVYSLNEHMGYCGAELFTSVDLEVTEEIDELEVSKPSADIFIQEGGIVNPEELIGTLLGSI